MKDDNFIGYWAAVTMTLTVAGGVVVPLSSIAIFIFMFSCFWHCISRSMDRPIKMWSPIPLRLDSEWCFIYYLTDGSHMVSPRELFLTEITK